MPEQLTFAFARTKKRCTGCGVVKPLQKFQRSSFTTDGRKCRCADCRNEDNKPHNAKYHRVNREAHNEASRQWRKNNAERRRAQRRARRANNREKVNAEQRDWRRRNPSNCRGYASTAKAKRKKRYVSWADMGAIERIYRMAPPGHHVDHAIPMNGKRVSGLHVLANLQLLTEEENRAKSNRYEPKWEIFREDLLCPS